MSSSRRTPPSSATVASYPPTTYSLDDEQLLQIRSSLAVQDMPGIPATRNLDDVPEEEGAGSEEGSGSTRGSDVSRTPYLNVSAANSSTTLINGGGPGSGSSTPVPQAGPSRQPRKTPSIRTLGRASNEQLAAGSSSSSGHSVRRSASATSTLKGHRDRDRDRQSKPPEPKTRSAPRIHHDKDAEPAPATGMHWSRAAVWGVLPSRTLRSPSITLIDNMAWIIGGSDDREAANTKDVLTFDTETMQWARPETIGEGPPPCRAHTATLIDKKIVVYGGGISGSYYGQLYIFDTVGRRWSQPPVHDGPKPIPRRAHTAVWYKNKIWIFGGGNGLMALSDLWTLDMGPNLNGVLDPATGKRAAKWTEIEVSGLKPGPRGYHTATLVKDTMVVVGGSDSKECYTDIWCLNLDTLVWKKANTQTPMYKRLSHSASQVGSYLFIIGGHNGGDYCSEILFLNLVSLVYEARTVYGKGPSSRGNHATILADSRVFLFGGYNGVQGFDDVFVLDLAASAYLPQVTTFEIEALPD